MQQGYEEAIDKVKVCTENMSTYRSAHCFHGLLTTEVFRQAEIDHLDARWIVFIREHEVLWLDIPMTDVLRMKIDQCAKELIHNHSSFSFIQMLPL